MFTNTLASNQNDQSTTQETNTLFHAGDKYATEDYLNDDEDQFIELLENSKDDGDRRGVNSSSGNYQGSNKYSISQQDTLYYKRQQNKKAKNFKINKTPFLMGEKPFVIEGSTHKSNTLSYNPLNDDHLKGFFLNKNVRRQIKSNQLVDKEGKILDKYYVKLNSSKESSSNPAKNIAQSFQLNLSNDQLYKDEINKFFDQSKSKPHQRIDMKIETLQDDVNIKQRIHIKQQELLKSYDSPRDRRRIKEMNASQKQLIQQGIYQQTYLSGHISDRIYPSSNNTNVKSAYSGYNGLTQQNFRPDQVKCKTPDPYSQNKLINRGFKPSSTPTPNKVIHTGSSEKSMANNNSNSNNTLILDSKQSIEERKKMLQERKQLVKKQQLELARSQAIQVQLKLAKQKELQQQKLLLIQKQEEQIKQYKLLMSASQTRIDGFQEKSPSNNIMNNNSNISNQNSMLSNYQSNISNYLQKAPVIPTKLYNGKRAKLTSYQVNDTYTQFDKHLFQQKRCQSVESNHQNQSTSFSSHPNVTNLQNESFTDNQSILKKLNQNMIQIQQLQTKNSMKSNTPMSVSTKENASEKKENKNTQPQTQSQQNSIKPTKFQVVTNSNRYNQKGSAPPTHYYSASATKTTNIDSSSSKKGDLPNSSNLKARVTPFTPGKRDLSITPNRLSSIAQKSQQSTIQINNSINIVHHNSESNQNKDIEHNNICTQKKDNEENDISKNEDVSLSKDDFKSYMIQQVQNLQQDTINIKNIQNVETPNKQISKEQFDLFMSKYKNKANMQTNAASPDRAHEKQEVQQNM